MSNRGIDTVADLPQDNGVADSKRYRSFIMISASPEYKERVARAAEAEGLTTSSFVRHLLALHLRREGDDVENGK